MKRGEKRCLEEYFHPQPTPFLVHMNLRVYNHRRRNNNFAQKIGKIDPVISSFLSCSLCPIISLSVTIGGY